MIVLKRLVVYGFDLRLSDFIGVALVLLAGTALRLFIKLVSYILFLMHTLGK